MPVYSEREKRHHQLNPESYFSPPGTYIDTTGERRSMAEPYSPTQKDEFGEAVDPQGVGAGSPFPAGDVEDGEPPGPPTEQDVGSTYNENKEIIREIRAYAAEILADPTRPGPPPSTIRFMVRKGIITTEAGEVLSKRRLTAGTYGKDEEEEEEPEKYQGMLREAWKFIENIPLPLYKMPSILHEYRQAYSEDRDPVFGEGLTPGRAVIMGKELPSSAMDLYYSFAGSKGGINTQTDPPMVGLFGGWEIGEDGKMTEVGAWEGMGRFYSLAKELVGVGGGRTPGKAILEATARELGARLEDPESSESKTLREMFGPTIDITKGLLKGDIEPLLKEIEKDPAGMIMEFGALGPLGRVSGLPAALKQSIKLISKKSPKPPAAIAPPKRPKAPGAGDTPPIGYPDTDDVLKNVIMEFVERPLRSIKKVASKAAAEATWTAGSSIYGLPKHALLRIYKRWLDRYDGKVDLGPEGLAKFRENYKEIIDEFGGDEKKALNYAFPLLLFGKKGDKKRSLIRIIKKEHKDALNKLNVDIDSKSLDADGRLYISKLRKEMNDELKKTSGFSFENTEGKGSNITLSGKDDPNVIAVKLFTDKIDDFVGKNSVPIMAQRSGLSGFTGLEEKSVKTGFKGNKVTEGPLKAQRMMGGEESTLGSLFDAYKSIRDLPDRKLLHPQVLKGIDAANDVFKEFLNDLAPGFKKAQKSFEEGHKLGANIADAIKTSLGSGAGDFPTATPKPGFIEGITELDQGQLYRYRNSINSGTAADIVELFGRDGDKTKLVGLIEKLEKKTGEPILEMVDALLAEPLKPDISTMIKRFTDKLPKRIRNTRGTIPGGLAGLAAGGGAGALYTMGIGPGIMGATAAGGLIGAFTLGSPRNVLRIMKIFGYRPKVAKRVSDAIHEFRSLFPGQSFDFYDSITIGAVLEMLAQRSMMNQQSDERRDLLAELGQAKVNQGRGSLTKEEWLKRLTTRNGPEQPTNKRRVVFKNQPTNERRVVFKKAMTGQSQD